MKQLKPILRELSRKQLSSFSNPLPQEVAAEAIAFEKWERVAGLEENFLKQRSKLHWLHVGDKNNKIFYNAIKERTTKNAIHKVTNPNGFCLKNMEDIKGEGVRFFFGFAISHTTGVHRDLVGLSPNLNPLTMYYSRESPALGGYHGSRGKTGDFFYAF